MSVSPAVMRRLMRELNQLRNEPPEGIRVVTNEENILDVTGIIQGPEGTPYAGGYFRVKFQFTEEFPAAPPKCWFATKIFHPNVSSAGEICVNTLKKDWQSSYGISHILVTVKCLLIYPNPESALDEEAGKLLLENYDSYCERAKLITSVHATPRIRPVEFETPASNAAPSAATAASSSSSTSATILPSPTTTLTSQATPFLAVPAPTTTLRKSSSPAPVSTSQPLQSSVSNTLPLSGSTSISSEKDILKLAGPAPLANTNTNAGAGAGASSGPVSSKAMKRPAGASTGEKRKKALKRL